MNRLVVGALAVAALGAGSIARAQSLYDPVVFTAVDSVRFEYSYVYVTGIVEGEGTAREVVIPFSSTTPQRETCERLILLAMTKPGQYRVTLQRVQYSPTPHAICTLSRVSP